MADGKTPRRSHTRRSKAALGLSVPNQPPTHRSVIMSPLHAEGRHIPPSLERGVLGSQFQNPLGRIQPIQYDSFFRLIVDVSFTLYNESVAPGITPPAGVLDDSKFYMVLRIAARPICV